MPPGLSFFTDPKGFLEENIVEVTAPDPDSLPKDHIVMLALYEKQGLQIGNKKNGKVYDLYVTSKPATQHLDAYFCPYANDASYFITLSNKAKFMFTPKMDGCSFGVGNQGAKGAVRVGHVNFTALQSDWREEGYEAGRDRMYQAQRNFLGNRLGNAAQVVDPADYRGNQGTDAATTFGALGSDKWSFYTLRYSRPGNKSFLHLGVHNHVSGG